MNKRGNWTGKHTRQVTYEEMKEYGEYFCSMRKSIGLSQDQMANELGVTKSTLFRWEKGRIIPQRDIQEIVDDVKYIVKWYQNKQRRELEDDVLSNQDRVIAKENNIPTKTLYARINFYNWDKEKAITESVEGNSEYQHWLKVAKSKGVKQNLFSYRIHKKKMTYEEAANTPVRPRKQPVMKG